MIRILVIVAIAVALFFLEQKISKIVWRKDLDVTLSFRQYAITAGQPGVITEIVENNKKLPVSMVQVKFETSKNLLFVNEKGSRTTDRYYRSDVFRLKGKERIIRNLTFTAGRRGYYHIDEFDVIGYNLFLTSKYILTMEETTALYVYPKPFLSEEFQNCLYSLYGDSQCIQPLIEDPFSFRGLREYQAGDDFHNINWKASAKQNQMTVNLRDYCSQKPVQVFLNFDNDGILEKDEAMEVSIELAAGIADYFYKKGILIHLFAGAPTKDGDKSFVFESGTGAEKWTELMEGLACLDLKKRRSFLKDFKKIKKSLSKDMALCFISVNFYPEYCEQLLDLIKEGYTIYLFCPIWEKNEPELPDELDGLVHFIHFRVDAYR